MALFLVWIWGPSGTYLGGRGEVGMRVISSRRPAAAPGAPRVFLSVPGLWAGLSIEFQDKPEPASCFPIWRARPPF